MKPTTYVKRTCGKPHPENKDWRKDELFCTRPEKHLFKHMTIHRGEKVYWD